MSSSHSVPDPFHNQPDLSAIPKSPLATAVDSHGYNVLHHHICALSGAAYENLELLQLLCHVGAPLDAKDKKGLTPLDHALKRGACMVAKGLLKCMEKAAKDFVRILNPSGPIFCLLFGVSSHYAQPITGQVTEVTYHVIGQAQPELTLSTR